MNLSSNALAVLQDRYYKPYDKSPEDVFRRVANFVAKAEEKFGGDATYWAERFYNELFEPLVFLPNSPTIANAGSNTGCLSACFVISPQDTMENIFDTQKYWGLVEKWGGGVGASFDEIRPRGSKISTVHGKALGPVAVMRMLATNASEITQGAFRLGAHMGMLSVTHPDIRDFIHCKDAEALDPRDNPVEWLQAMQLQNFNITVKVTDAFMQAVENDEFIKLEHPKSEKSTIIKARELWNEICESAWKTGDPGIAFIDRIRETEPNPHLGLIQSSNPCGEEWLENFGSCNLGSIDLGKFVQNGEIQLDRLRETIHLATRFLNDVIEVNQFPLEQIADMNRRTKRIGLGVMGVADMFIALGIPYGSPESFTIAEKVAKFLVEEAWSESARLAEQRGAYDEYENSELKKRRDAQGLPPVRNSSVVTIAPTGTISLLAGCSGGIEPHFSIAWKRKSLWKDQERAKLEIIETSPALRKALEDKGLDVENVLLTIAEANSPSEQREILRQYGIDPKPYVTAMELSAEAHILMQAAWQKYVTNSVSKTINMPNSATVEDVSEAYKLAWKAGCKCVTIYRDGSKHIQVLSTGSGKKEPEVKVRMRPRKMHSFSQRVKTPEGNVYVEVTLDENGLPFEIFTNIGKSGDTVHAFQEAVSRLASLYLRTGNGDVLDRVREIVDQLRGITSGVAWDEGRMVTSTPDGVALVLQENFLNQRLPRTEDTSESSVIVKSPNSSNWSEVTKITALCPQCSSDKIIFKEGCSVCDDCGYSKCD